MKVADFDYHLPEELIAQEPMNPRDESRLMIVDRNSDEIEERVFKEIIDFFESGDTIVLNNTKVIPARLYGFKEETGGKVEFLLLTEVGLDTWEVLVRPGKKVKIGTRVVFGDRDLIAEVKERTEFGGRVVKFEYDGVFAEILDKLGEMPLPPYITKELEEREQYQTVFAKKRGAAAAPTAGLHFTEEVLSKLEEKGVNIVYITLHVGLGTFRPVRAEKVEEHDMHAEYYEVSQETAEIINKTKEEGKRVFAVGTTVTRTLETVGNEGGYVKADKGWTDIFIYPGYEYRVVDALLTNFHLPKSTLIMLVSAFCGQDLVMEAYQKAVEDEYRFYSFGDAMLII
ncbi:MULTISPECIES: tRNA preQ1(34) S-adenosylmethionine ribosyltransferase-isomerase QueA [unclassified Candidatus Frackibacter]|uniref:tRNA preQ1(34) S-adenosylmethionine ribosyltransferase-isomerase QueA n=1 Tax=unclassified Candidatus Frackibacter TaxID=2648818 RepID=UPI00088AF2DD|nr:MULTISPECIES: tRNA preQ1(34) S-adenosylmethionine ribosyltransferase-isomerase QueA [unclassified Candidatus Frackibacter]SDC64030.1 S-adenosylmethionine--tRNA ribosyltransferase-isomerase [Candidatus Frackibacter sp. WG11]SEM77804.1 S-adenosylmethionine--tRNA ribosyltransferase-isomerase [Candidatus Frackibacter sp. WG12]SFL88299.1 S-adenosylmethionine--tRNA ribosyltransferase-isomerase [Candidatus Frackibacter sp. WG13]